MARAKVSMGATSGYKKKKAPSSSNLGKSKGYGMGYGEWNWEEHLTEHTKNPKGFKRPVIEGLGGMI